MPEYHKYVFDVEKREFIGAFEEMYQNEDTKGYDSWYERDLRELRKTISYSILNQYNFERILEIGCGKGTFTHLLKRVNNDITAIDVSETAIRKAKESYRDIHFRCCNAMNVADIVDGKQYDLVLVMGTFAYIEQWRELLKGIAGMTRWIYVAEFIPHQPIGFVKSSGQLIEEVSKNYDIRHKVLLDDVHCMLFAEARR